MSKTQSSFKSEYARFPKLVDASELGHLLGRPAKSIYKAAASNDGTVPPGTKIGRKLRWHPDDVQRWLDERFAASRQPERTAQRA